MPTLATTLILLALAAPADDPFTIGDAAPALDIAHWMKGEAITTFEPGHVYVLEFWATWCGPCVGAMEHLSEIQERYAERDVHVIGVSDEPLQTTVAFLLRPADDEGRRQNDRVRYALATDPDRSVHREYFDAANLRAIPATFIIGRDAHLEWIGHPARMDDVLEAVLDGTWDRAAHRAESLEAQRRSGALRAARAQLSAAMDEERWEDALESIDSLIRQGEPNLEPTRIGILLSRMRDYERGYAVVRAAMDEAWDSDGLLLHQIAWYLTYQDEFPIDPEHRDLDLALRAARRAVELDPVDYHLQTLARVHAERGERAEAAAAQARAIELLEAMRPHIRPHEMERYEEHLRTLREELAQYEGK